ncbi:MAG: triose-phosphate isomerase, partial [Candidatus Bipolaricaulis sp.]|nr:triose-phosphate isomerase [Candidatus Bipolaricaulis sp.]
MHKTIPEARAYLERLLELVGREAGVEVVVIPSFTSLPAAAELLAGT